MSDTPNLTAALAAVQAELPEISKGHTAEVTSERTGKTFKYAYADLAAVSKAILPLLGKNGLAWITKPTFVEGKFLLVYKLRHVSGEEETGEYPLTNGTPQQIGSSITYARRYALCSVTGVAPESDDDDAKAAATRQADEWEAAKPPTDEQADAFGAFRVELTNVKRRVDIGPIGKRVKDALDAGGITKAQYDRLDILAGKRIAELEQESAGD